jgi:hypothetical protein
VRNGVTEAVDRDPDPRLIRLHDLWNIDKHRDLPVAVVQLDDLFYWNSDDGDPTYRLLPPQEIPSQMTDGTSLAYFRGPEGTGHPVSLVNFRRTLLSDPVLGSVGQPCTTR